MRSNRRPNSYARNFRRTRQAPTLKGTRTITIQNVSLPLSVARRARRETYNYAPPSLLQRRSRVRRIALHHRPSTKWVRTNVRIRIPKILPLAKASYVSVRRGKINIHSVRQTRRAIETERNRARYAERKPGHRQARNNQLGSPGSNRAGIVSHAVSTGMGATGIADHALVTRAIFGG